MKSEITGNNASIIKFELDKEETILAETGNTLWKNQGINKKTNLNGGFFKGIGRAFTGETMFINTYTCNNEKAEIAFSPDSGKKIIEFDLEQDSNILCQKGSFLCGDNTITTHTISTKQVGNNLFMQRIGGKGKVFLAVDYNVVGRELGEGEILEIDNASIVAMSGQTKLLKKKNGVFGWLGFSNTIVQGPGKIWLEQNRM